MFLPTIAQATSWAQGNQSPNFMPSMFMLLSVSPHVFPFVTSPGEKHRNTSGVAAVVAHL